MNFLRNNIYFVCALSFILLIALLLKSNWKEKNTDRYQFIHDTKQYYSYLPQLFIENDFGFEGDNKNLYWLYELENGKKVQRMTFGMSFFYAPFFLIGHAYASSSSKYKANGYSLPYSISLKTGSVFYVFIGLFFAYKNISFFFSKSISAISIVLIFLGTNLFFYSFWVGEMTHSYLFSLFSIFIYQTIKWQKTHEVKRIYYLAIILGISVLIRPTSLIILLFPLTYGGFNNVKKNLLNVFSLQTKLILPILLFTAPIILQMIYWKVYTDYWVLWSYGDERFYFNNPKIMEYLIGFRKGMLIYSPILAFSLVGLLISFKKFKFNFSILTIFLLSTYVLSSWWCWWFGGGMGSRASVEYYSFLVLPLASLINYCRKLKVKYFVYPFAVLMVIYSVYIHKLYGPNIHWDSMSAKALWIGLKNPKNMSNQDKKLYNEALIHPNYEKARANSD